ncbi:MAG: glucosaminidase domain-containing protein [Acidobacteria bacterium]|nr:glucosaminidase domain-containing protein [Acidobacteriota bacterium]
MRRPWYLSFLVFSGMMLFHPAQAKAPVPLSVMRKDPRIIRLQRFFQRFGCPARKFSQEFLAASDSNGLDWRLLPGIAFVESGAGKNYANNNILGWGSGRIAFRSVPEGIHSVAGRLAQSDHYRDKSLDEILWTYNPVEGYADKVKSVMEELGPADLLPAVAE